MEVKFTFKAATVPIRFVICFPVLIGSSGFPRYLYYKGIDSAWGFFLFGLCGVFGTYLV